LERSSKTIQRDLSYMQDRLGLPIEYDDATKGYHYTRMVPYFPVGPDLSADERLALVVARQSLQVFKGVDLGGELNSAFEKITGGLVDEYPDIMGKSLDPYLSVRTPGAGIISDVKVFRAVRLALLRSTELKIEYQKVWEGGSRAKVRAYSPRRLHPYHLACVANRWILVALDAEKNQIRTYVLARCRNPVVTQTEFQRPKDFKPEAYIGSSFGDWTGTGKRLVKLRISAAGSHHVLERHWHDTQQVTPLPGGVVEVTFMLSDFNDLTRWILGFGSDCEVVEPPELRDAIAEEGRKMADVNRRLQP
jgi:proteasome accessory factor B